ncbi:MAG: cytochrome c oxidase subunit II [Planctomycetota bacterium]
MTFLKFTLACFLIVFSLATFACGKSPEEQRHNEAEPPAKEETGTVGDEFSRILLEGGQEAFERGRRVAVDWQGLKIGVIGRRHVWTTVYPGEDNILWTDDDLTEEGRMTMPADIEVGLEIKSDDVIHALFIPRARVKKDAVPGRTNYWLMQKLALGEYDYFCSEYCGQDHSEMTGVLHVVKQEEYAQHLESLAEKSNLP